jgi:glycine cleavage system transcriptional repressor
MLETLSHLVLTAIGKDKTGLVSELTDLISACQCNIVDSKMAIFGGEFTMIMLIAGDNNALLQLETKLPQVAFELDLLTMMKRTTSHTPLSQNQFVLLIDGPDRPGTIKAVTRMLANNQVAIASLKSKAMVRDQKAWQQAEVIIAIPESVHIEEVESEAQNLCQLLNVNCEIKPIVVES